MSGSGSPTAIGFNDQFFDRLQRLEGRHQRLQSEHEVARRGLERLEAGAGEELREAWRHYCEVVGELDHISATIAAFYTRSL